MPTTTEPISPALLAKVRALLAKAASTDFEAEAEALTLKAQELMARHRIEQAMLDAEAADGTEPSKQRIRIHDPYASAKSFLLSVIGDANGCSVIWSQHERCAYVFGFGEELAWVEEMFASLLLQADVALEREGPKRDASGRNRTKRFRRAFLLSFAVRIGQRLRATVDSTVDDVGESTGAAIVPVLADRVARSEAAAREAFPMARAKSTQINDGDGWRAGREFADHARLGARRRAVESTA